MSSPNLIQFGLCASEVHPNVWDPLKNWRRKFANSAILSSALSDCVEWYTDASWVSRTSESCRIAKLASDQSLSRYNWVLNCPILLKFGRLVHYASAEPAWWLKPRMASETGASRGSASLIDTFSSNFTSVSQRLEQRPCHVSQHLCNILLAEGCSVLCSNICIRIW